ncbi:ATP synthase F1 subunit epsilon [Candidatus Palauibacter sp.]|uniref:ATP synthase F1 subunit epsilon n=1 Tax=Candidatus Palauibacter sp. TaxID=3101350 RepID=UPI003D127B36
MTATASAQRRLNVTVISPSAAAFSGAATSIIAPAHDGELGILYGHAPMVVLLGEGLLRIRTDDGSRRFRVARGFLQVLDNTVAVLAEEVEPAAES